MSRADFANSTLRRMSRAASARSEAEGLRMQLDSTRDEVCYCNYYYNDNNIYI